MLQFQNVFVLDFDKGSPSKMAVCRVEEFLAHARFHKVPLQMPAAANRIVFFLNEEHGKTIAFEFRGIYVEFQFQIMSLVPVLLDLKKQNRSIHKQHDDERLRRSPSGVWGSH